MLGEERRLKNYDEVYKQREKTKEYTNGHNKDL